MRKKLIAEFCQNHLGKRDLILQMIAAAHNAGATHAKIQGIYADELVKRQEFEFGYKSQVIDEFPMVRPFDQEYKRLLPLTLSEEDEEWFVESCKGNGITPMTTVFTHRGVQRARNAGFTSIKIASYDCASIPLIASVLEFCSELVISTGATTWSEVVQTAKFLKAQAKLHDITFLHAVTEYPNSLGDTRLLRMQALRALGFEIGFSDHTSPAESGLSASAIAILLGATTIERHFTILGSEETKDGPVSVNPEQLHLLNRMLVQEDTNALYAAAGDLTELGNLLAPLKSLEPSLLEIRNARYYKGRVASSINGTVINAWQEWSV